MANTNGFPATTHQWLQPLYKALNSPTGKPAFYGTTGIPQIATGGLYVVAGSALGASGFQATGMGASGLYTHLANAAFNGGSGAAYTMTDLVAQLKNMNILKR